MMNFSECSPTSIHLKYTRGIKNVYPKFPERAASTGDGKQHSFLPLRIVLPLSSVPVQWVLQP
jgi:hypothetical protein